MYFDFQDYIVIMFLYGCSCANGLLPFFSMGGRNSRQLPVPAAVDVAKVLEHQSEPGAQPSLPRKGTTQVLETRNHGGGDLQRTQGRTVT